MIRTRFDGNIMTRARSPARSRQFLWLSWHHPAGSSLARRQSRLVPRTALLACSADLNAPAEGAHSPPTAPAARNRSHRPPSQAKPTSITRPTTPLRQMVRPKSIPRRNRVYRHTRLQAFRNDLRLDLIRPPFLAIGPYLHPVVPEKLHRSRHRETPAPISIRSGLAGQAKTRKVAARKRLRRACGWPRSAPRDRSQPLTCWRCARPAPCG